MNMQDHAWSCMPWLDALGLERPKRPELYDVLKAFKNNDPNEINRPMKLP